MRAGFPNIVIAAASGELRSNPYMRQQRKTVHDVRIRSIETATCIDVRAGDCNACSLKNNCTDSNDGRLLKSHLDSWIESELRRFHRGISLALLLLATIILVAEAVRYAAPRDLLIIGCLLLPVGLAGTKLFASFLARQHDT